jgi:protein phosphatase
MSLPDLTLDYYGMSDKGLKRPMNEDQFLIAELNKSILIKQTSLSQAQPQRLLSDSQNQLFLVADGMGGHEGGEIASSLAVSTTIAQFLNFIPWFAQLDDWKDRDLRDELLDALEACQSKVEAAKESEKQKMGTTLTFTHVSWPRLHVVHVGDSRCYLLRDGKLKQITVDHTLAQQMVEQGTLKPETAKKSRWSNILWNAIGGGSPRLKPELHEEDLRSGDTLLLCTDGLTRHVSDKQIIDSFSNPNRTMKTAAQNLVAMANNAGGSDNITVVTAKYHEATA